MRSSLLLDIMTGMVSGLLGITLMIFSVDLLYNNIIIDFRYLPLLLTAIFCGFFPTMLSSLLIGVFRIIYFGYSEASIIALVTALAAGLGFSIICHVLTSRKSKWIYSLIYLFVIFSVAMRIAMKDSNTYFTILITYIISNLCVCYVAYIYTEYLCATIRLNRKLKKEATKDFLTGLNNVRQFEATFNSLSQLAVKKEESLSLLYIDIDFFKTVNDSYGHNIGDSVLKHLGEIFVDTARVFDVISRNGGEEFSIILLDCSSEHAERIAERLRKAVEAHDFIISDKLKINITVSIGISSYPSTTSDIDKLLEHADLALYEAKRTGRNKVILYRED
jgi:diguanylate cyclase (GGDEF) domain